MAALIIQYSSPPISDYTLIRSSHLVKVSKSRKQILKFSLEPKIERKYFFHFCPSSLKWVKPKKGMQIIILDDK